MPGNLSDFLHLHGSEAADRANSTVHLLLSLLLVALPPIGLSTLRFAALGVIVNIVGYLAVALLPGTAVARFIAAGAILAVPAAAYQLDALFFPLFGALLLLAQAFYLDTRFPLLGGLMAISVQTVLAVAHGQTPKTALVSIAILAGVSTLSAMLALMLRRQSLLLADRGRRIPQLEEELATAQQNAGVALRMKHDMLANLSHEIRTPLNGVLGMSRLLMDTRLSAEQRELTQTLERSTTALLDIMNEVLDFSALESGRVQLDSQRFDFHRPYEDVIELLGPIAQGKGVELLAEFDATIPMQVIGDSRRMRQVLLNLAGNALKFTDSGHILIRTAVEELLDHEIVVRTEVVDTGPGISQEDHGRIFQPFAQGKTEHAGKYGGAGLGLTISKRLVEMMRGDIGFKTSFGRGTRFWFTVRCRRMEDECFFDTSALSGQRVLALSRYPASAGVAASQLRLWGIDAFAASQPDAALAELIRGRQSGKPYDIVLLDGEQSGPHRTVALLERVATIGRIPSVGVLPFGQWAGNEERGVPWFDAIVNKPLRPSQLWKSLCVARFGPDLPVPEPDSDQAVAQPGQEMNRILLVEDNPINQKVALRMLQKLGYSVDVASNGRFALEMMSCGTDYAAVLMDCMMPEMDGFETTRVIRQREHGQSRIPVIALTAHALHAERERCLQSGMDDYITKPVHLEVLRQALERWVGAAPRTRTQAAGSDIHD